MRYSKTITGLTGGGSDGWDIYRKARRMQRDGTEVTMLTIGEHDIRTDAQILDALHRFAHAGHTGYTGLFHLLGYPCIWQGVCQKAAAVADEWTYR